MAIDFGLWTDLSVIERKFTELAASGDVFGLDIETGYNGPPREKGALRCEISFPAGMSFSGDPSWARYVPLAHVRGHNVDNRSFALLLAPLLATGKSVAHNMLFELRRIAKFFRTHLTVEEIASFGLPPSGYFPFHSDSMIEAYLLGRFRAVGLKPLTWDVFRYQMVEIQDLFPGLTDTQKKCIRFSELELTSQVISYACDDAAWCLAHSRRHRPLVADRLLYATEMALIPIIAEMEDYGVAMDWVSMERARVRAERFSVAQRREVMRVLSDQLGKPIDINLNSSAQVADVLYRQLGLKTTRVTKKTGNMSTDEKAMAGLARKHAVVREIIDWREIRKLIGSYLEKYPRDFNISEDHRTHSSYNQIRAASGRTSVSDPGHQQFPKKYEYHLASGEEFYLNFRDLVVSGLDHYLIGFDYSQIELRVLAALSGEPALVRAYQEGVDVHALTASMLFDVPLSEVIARQRDRGKTFNFSVAYGQGVKALAESLGVSFEEAKSLNERFFGIYSSIKAWKERQVRLGVEQGYTTSQFGRRHPIWELESESGAMRSKGERLCVNAPVQGNAADLCKIAMVRADRALARANLKDRVHMIMNIHDALVFEAHVSVPPQTIIDLVQPAVVFPVPGWPPIVVDWEVGRRWGSMVKLKLDERHQIIVPDAIARTSALVG